MASRGPSTKGRMSGLLKTGLLRRRAATLAAASVACNPGSLHQPILTRQACYHMFLAVSCSVMYVRP